MRRMASLVYILAVSLAACSTPTPGMTPVPSPILPSALPSPEPTTTTVITPTPTHLPNAIPTGELDLSRFHFYEGNPVVQHSNNPQWDDVYIDPGAMVFYDGLFHMFFNGINGFPAPVGIGYATSPDGYHWTRQVMEPVFSAKSLNGAGNLLGTNFFVTSALVENDGTWVLYFYTLTGNTFNGPGGIGRATAPAPTGPWTIDPNPVLSPGPSGAWDDVQVNAPDVLETDGGYVMYYDAHGKDTTSMIGRATSPDGIHWNKYNDPATTDPAFVESDPVLKTSDKDWDSTRVVDPNVVKTPDGWQMIYLATTGAGKFSAGDFAFGAAHSSDGIHWTKSRQNPVLSTKDHSQWSQVFLATMLYVKDTYYLYFDFVTPTRRGTNVYLATYTGSLK